MQKALPSPLFLWPRGRRGRWKARRAVINGWPDAQIIYDGRWPSRLAKDANSYSPLEDPHIFEAFADVGRIAREAAVRLDQTSPRLVTVALADPMAMARHRAALTVAFDTPDVIAAVLRFVRNYGPLDLSQSLVLEPVTTDDGMTVLRAHEQWLSGRDFIKCAAEMAEAVRLAASAEPYPRWLNDVINEHLRGTHKASLNADELGTARGYYVFTFDSLLAALWWQFSEADDPDNPGHAWRVCKGCQRTFVQSRTDQVFHDKNCRNRTNVAIAAKKRAAQPPKKRSPKTRKKGR